MTRDKMRATWDALPESSGTTIPMRFFPSSSRARAHFAAASISCVAEGKEARAHEPAAGSGSQRANSNFPRNSCVCGGITSKA